MKIQRLTNIEWSTLYVCVCVYGVGCGNSHFLTPADNPSDIWEE